MTRRLAIVLVVTLPSFAVWGSTERQALILAKVDSVTTVQAMSGPASPTVIVIGDLYRVSLRDVKVVRGNVILPNRLSVDLIATEKTVIRRNRTLFVLLRMEEGGSFHALGWGEPLRIACLNKSLVADGDLSNSFEGYERYDGAVCSTLDT